MKKYKDNYHPGYDVHWIQSSHAMRDHKEWRVGKLVHVGQTELDVEVEGTIRRYYCYYAPDIKASIEKGSWHGKGSPSVIIIDKWHVMLLPIGPKGSPPPDIISYYGNALHMGHGSDAEVLTPEDAYQLQIYSLSSKPLT